MISFDSSPNPPTVPMLTVLGSTGSAGSYLHRIRVSVPLAIVFGRFRGRELIHVPAGEYVYVGSALSSRGSTSLARRLVRHASRSGENPPHAIRDLLLTEHASLGAPTPDLLPRSGKTLFWNVDHLLDRLEAELIGIIAVRSPVRMERELALLVASDAGTTPLAKRLGANDLPGVTNLVRVEAASGWWEELARRVDCLRERLERERGPGTPR
ncbi:DUF123 domain-containing protein [Candidatus Poribacteria bacterium]|nr:DUF123 domain-containing protein [Candidatus Poribacteria bacterium]